MKGIDEKTDSNEINNKTKIIIKQILLIISLTLNDLFI